MNFSTICIHFCQIHWEPRATSVLIGWISKTFYLLSVCAASHIFMTWNELLGATLLLSINHSCFPNHLRLHLSLSYLLLSSKEGCSVLVAWSGLHDMICVSAYQGFFYWTLYIIFFPAPHPLLVSGTRGPYICKMTAVMRNGSLVHMALITHRLIFHTKDNACFPARQTIVKTRGNT